MNERDKLILVAIFDEIDVVRMRQAGMWGHEFDDKNTPNDWVTFVTRYLSRAADDTVTQPSHIEKFYRLNMVKAATVCIAAIEAFDRAQGTVARHYE